MLKLSNPIGVAEHLVKKYLAELELRKKSFSNDENALHEVKAMFEEYKATMLADFKLQQHRLDNILLQLLDVCIAQNASLMLDSEATASWTIV